MREVLVDPYLRTKVDHAIALLKQGKVPDWVVKCALKDEILPQEKVDIGKTRMYYVAPLDHAVVCRMLFGDLMSAALISRISEPGQASCSVGVKFDDGVLRAFHALASAGNHFAFAADQKGWDNHQHWEFARYVANAINGWYKQQEDPEWKVARYTYLMSCYTSTYVLDGLVYRMPFGLPSGIAITSQMNSWYLEMVTLYSGYVNAPAEVRKRGVDQFKREVFALYYGDDSWVLFPKIWGLTSAKLFATMTELGLEATHSDKTLSPKEELPYEKQTFLKRTLAVNADGHLTFALPRHVIENQLLWIKKKHYDSIPVMKSILESHFEEAARHGIAYFEERRAIVADACAELGVDIPCPTTISHYSNSPL